MSDAETERKKAANRRAQARFRANYGNQPVDPKHHNYKGDRITYNSAHARVKVAKGRPSEHPCLICGAPAQDWGLDPDAPLQNLRCDADGKNRGYVFSINIEDYRPLCRPHNAAERELRVMTRSSESRAQEVS